MIPSLPIYTDIARGTSEAPIDPSPLIFRSPDSGIETLEPRSKSAVCGARSGTPKSAGREAAQSIVARQVKANGLVRSLWVFDVIY